MGIKEQRTFKILVVDDNPKNVQIIGSILREASYQVGVALDGKKALELLNESPDYDLVLLDINMPGLDGFEVCHLIRLDPRMSEMPVIFLTAFADSEKIIEGFTVGAQDYVTKPFNSKELLSRIRTHLELKHNRDLLKQMNQVLEEKVRERTAELMETNLKLQKLNEELESLDASKADFLRIISHEINTPLNGMLGFTSLLKEELKSSEFYDLLHYLDLSAQRLARFSKASLLITQLRTRKKPVARVPLPVEPLINAALDKLQYKINELRLQFTRVGFTKESLILGNRNLLETCFESIIENAIRFSKPGSEIILKFGRTNVGVILSITDSGSGFSEEALKNLFKLFSTGQPHHDQSSGLDLALVKLIMDAHGGDIQVTNNRTGGATVMLVFEGDPEKP